MAVAAYFKSTKDTRFFKTAFETLTAALDTLKDYKKSIKSLKQASTLQASLRMADPGRVQVDQKVFMEVSSELGRQSQVMLTLRLMQLMCEGQFQPLQDMMTKQPVDTASFDLLRKCIDFIETIQVLLFDSLAFNTGSLAILCMQVVETISETVQGPNLHNQKYLLSSKFLAVVNRVLSTLMYVPLQGSMRCVKGEKFSVSDLKCWLKTSLLNCCHAILEGVGDAKRSSRALEFFELRNFESQIVTMGQLLGLVDVDKNGYGPAMGHRRYSSRSSVNIFSTTFRLLKQGSSSESLSTRIDQTSKTSGSTGLSSTMHFAKGWEHAIERELFATYFLVVVMGEHDESGAVADWLSSLEKAHPKLYKHLVSHSSHVEIARSSGELAGVVEKVYFCIDQQVLDLTSNIDFRERTQKYIFGVPRGNPVEKARVFLSKSKKVLHTVSILSEIATSDRFGLTRFLSQRRDLVDSTARRFACLPSASPAHLSCERARTHACTHTHTHLRFCIDTGSQS